MVAGLAIMLGAATAHAAPVCPAGYTCETFNILAGLDGLSPIDDGHSTYLNIFDFTAGALGVPLIGATNGQVAVEPERLVLGQSTTTSELALINSVLYLSMKEAGDTGPLGAALEVCMKIQPDLAPQTGPGALYCGAGSVDYTARLTQDDGLFPTQFASPEVLTIPDVVAPLATGAGTGRAPVLVQFVVVQPPPAPGWDIPCSAADYSAAPTYHTSLTTSQATAEITNPWINGVPGPTWYDQSGSPSSTVLTGVPFDCTNWGQGTGSAASVMIPLTATNFPAPILNQPTDVPMVVRFELKPDVTPPTTGPVPANDNCGAATVIGALPFSDALDTTGATAEGGESAPSCVPTGSQTVWYTYTPAADGTLIVETCGSGYDTVVAAYSGSCGSTTELACNDDDWTISAGAPAVPGTSVDAPGTSACGGAGFSAHIAVPVTTGVPVLLQVVPWHTLTGGYLSVQMDLAPPPTATPTNTPTATDTPTNTPTATDTSAAIPTSTNTPAGTATRTPLSVPACPGGLREGVTLNGLAQSIDAGDFNLAGDQMTVALWTQVSSFSTETYPTLLSKWNNADPSNAVFVLNTGANLGQARMLIFADDGTLVGCFTDGAVKAVAGQWHHVAATLDGNKLRCYVDGVQTGSTGNWPAGRTIRQSTHHVRIGGRDDGKYLSGVVDDVRIYSRGLSAGEIATIYSGGNATCDNTASNLVAWWPLDDAAGTSATDSSGNLHTGTLTNGASWSDAFVCCGGPPTNTPTTTPTDTVTVSPTPTSTATPNPLGTCPGGTARHGLSLTGALAQSVDGGTWNPNPGGDQMTVALWANVTALTPEAYPTLISKWDNTDPNNAVFVLNTGSGLGQARMLVFADDGTLVMCRTDTVLNLVTNQWHHVAATLDGTRLRCYVDGVQVGSSGAWPAGRTIRQSAHHIRLGRRDDGKDLTGILDDVRIYSRGLSAGEISALYNGSSGECSNASADLVAWWKLDELSGLSSADSSGNGHTATLVHAPTWSDGMVCCP